VKFASVRRYYDDGKCSAFVVPVLFKFEVRAYHACRLYDQYTDVFDTREEAEAFGAEEVRLSAGEKVDPPRQQGIINIPRKNTGE